MVTLRAILVLSLFSYHSTVIATPIVQVNELRAARAQSDELYELYPRQEQQALSQPVTFKTVTTTQTQAGTITTTCNVTLSPVTAADGSTQIKQEKQCQFKVDTGNNNSSSSSSNGNGGQTSTTSAATETATQSQTQTESSTSSVSSSAAATGTAVPAISEIGVGVIPVSATGTVSPPSSSQTSASASASTSAPPAVSVIGPGQIPVSATGTVSDASVSVSASATELVTSVSTLSDGQLSTIISTPSAAAAEQAAATTPGQKLEVLPIGLGVFAGVSVIALIVVGLVTYERTKYRKAFRQRKLAEAGANMGYGGMAERT